MVQLMHCHPIISCFIKIQNGLTFLVLAYPGCPVKEATEWVSVCLIIAEIQGGSLAARQFYFSHFDTVHKCDEDAELR